MNIVFRVDASNLIGTGHVMRCLTLAEALRERGATPRFICRCHPGNLIQHLRNRAMSVSVLPSVSSCNSGSLTDYASWLGATQELDAEQTIQALDNQHPDWLVADHYALDRIWEQELRPYAHRIMVIDDLANRHHDCDLLLDQNFVESAQTRYQGLVPSTCRMLIGPHYALLRPEYAEWRKKKGMRNGNPRRVLVFMGGSDLQNLTGLALGVLSEVEFKGLKVDVVVGATNSHLSEIQSQVAQLPNATLHTHKPHLAELMAEADLAIGAGGATTWERLCVGLPAIVISVAKNQKPVCEALEKAGLIRYAGDAETVDMHQLHSLIIGMHHDCRHLTAMSAAAFPHVDGLGTKRLLEAICPSSAEQLKLRPARDGDATVYFNWANDPEVRRNAFNSDMISWPTHKVWFASKLTDPCSHLFVLEAQTLAVGQIRFDRKHNEASIDYSLDRLVRGRGWAVPLVALGIKEFSGGERLSLRADVKPTNHDSIAVFRRLSFSEITRPGDETVRIFHKDTDPTNSPSLFSD